MTRQYFNTLVKQKRQQKRYEDTRVLKGTGNVERCARRQAEAQDEADRKWTETIVYRAPGSKYYIVAGRDPNGKFHFGTSKVSWQAAFEDADKREGKQCQIM